MPIGVEIKRAIIQTTPDEFWEEKVDWEKQEPISPEVMALLAVSEVFVKDEIVMDLQDTEVLIRKLEESNCPEELIEPVRAKQIEHQRLAKIVSYSGTESVAHATITVRPPETLHDPLAFGV